MGSRHFRYLDHDITRDFVYATILLDRPDLFQLAVDAGSGKLYSPSYRNIGSALAFQLSETTTWQRALTIVLQKSEQRLASIWAALSSVREGYENSLKAKSASSQEKLSLDTLNDWIYSTLSECFANLRSTDSSDGDTLNKIAQESRDCERFLLRTLLPYVKRNKTNKGFVLTVLRTIYQSSQASRIKAEVAINLYQDILSDFGSDLLGLQETDNSAKRGYGHYYSFSGSSRLRESKDPRIDVGSIELANLCKQSLALGLNDEVQKILYEIVSKSGQYDVKLFASSWIPFLRDLLPTLNGLPGEAPKQYRLSVQGIIDNYIRLYLISKPPQPITTSPTKLGCASCEPCRELNKFLADPKMEVGTFAKTAIIRKHLEMRIGNHYRTTVEKNGSPHRLLVHKKPDEFKALRALADFEERRAQAAKEIKSIGLGELNRLLGTSHNELISFDSPRNMELIAGGPSRAPLTSFTEHIDTNKGNQPALEIVDLTK